MKILSMHVFKWEEEKSIFVTSAYELGFVRYFFLHLSWYQRPFVK